MLQRPMSVRSRILRLFVLVAILPLCLLTAAGLGISLHQAGQALSIEGKESISKVQVSLARSTRRLEDLAQLVAHFTILQEKRSSAEIEQLLQLRQDFWSESFIEIFDEKAHLRARSVTIDSQQAAWFSSEGCNFIHLGLLGKRFSGLDDCGGGLVIRALSPIINSQSGKISGVVVASVPLNRATLNKMKEQLHADISLHLPNRNLVSTLQTADYLPLERDWLPHFARYENTIQPVQYTGQVENSSHVITLKTLNSMHGKNIAVISTAISEAPLAESVLSAMRMLGATLVVAVLLATVLAFWTADRFTRPVNRLVEALSSMSRGNLAVRVPDANLQEINELTHSFNVMVAQLSTERTRVLNALHEREESAQSLAKANSKLETAYKQMQATREDYRKIFTDSVQGIYRKRMDGAILKANPAMARLLGYASYQELRQASYNNNFTLFADAEEHKALQKILWERRSIVDHETKFLHTNGTAIPVSLSARFIFSAEGEPLYIEASVIDITERECRYEAERKREAAEAASEAKSQFLARMSHEVRTPLNAIMGMADLLWESKLSQEQRYYVDIFKKSGETLLELVNDVLDYSRAEAGKLQIHAENFALRPTVQRATEIHSLNASHKQLRLSIEIADDVPDALIGDSLRIRQIVSNLVNNAIKFTPKGFVHVAVERLSSEDASAMYKNADNQAQHTDDYDETEKLLLQSANALPIRICVSDSGIGIEDSVQTRLFESFTQADASITRQYGGTGLGLAIVKSIAQLMHGSVSLKSVVGEGTNISVDILLHAPKELPQEKVIEKETQENAPNSALRLLLAEDNANNRLLFSMYLKGSPHSVRLAENGEMALEQFQHGNFDVVFMDLEMPVMDGYEATKRIREWEQENGRHHTPIIALTAHVQANFKERCLQEGFDKYLTKPFRKQEFLDTLQEYQKEQ